MRISLTYILILAVQSCTEASTETQAEFRPDRVTYDILSSDPSTGTATPSAYEPLLDALSTEGLVSVTDIPGFAPLKRSLMKWLHTCIMDQGSDADNVLEMVQKDGTIRRSFASVTVPGPGGDQDFTLTAEEGQSLSPACHEFSKNLKEFRGLVADTTAMFSKRLHAEMSTLYKMPLMDTVDGSQSFHTLEDVVSSGEHLEHFHSYQKIHKSPSLLRSEKDETIELHTDQGFFIAFAPGLMVSHADNVPDNTPLWETEGFFIEKRDGTRAHVKFDSQDDLIFMMGDGVNQYINPKMKEHSSAQMRTLRATPHSVILPAHDENLSRVWYGRMILPPKDAHSNNDGKSYGEVRSLFTTSEVKPGSLGCSSQGEIRSLAEDHSGHNHNHGEHVGKCEEGSLWCWVRCMDLSTYNADTCDDQNLQLQCINPRDQFSNGDDHGDFYPGCSNTTTPDAPYDPLDNYPRNDTTCTDAEWENFSTADGYDHSFDLTSAKLMWTVKNEKIHGRLAYNGLHGWLALGFANLAENAGHNGMNGANILMSIPGDDYDAATGFDFTKNTSVAEYVIHEKASSFRHWKDPVVNSSSTVIASVNEHECFTYIDFEADGFNGQAFNTNGTDIMIWGANGKDKFAGYHGRSDRAKMSVEWSTGSVKILKAVKDDDDNGSTRMSTSLAMVFGFLATIAFF